jgi:hypothetical protein
MTTVFTDAGKVAGFIIQRGCVGFEAFTTDEKSVGMFENAASRRYGVAGACYGPLP